MTTRVGACILLAACGLALLTRTAPPAAAGPYDRGVLPRSKREINATIHEILGIGSAGAFGEQSQDAVALLNVYRYLAGAPPDVELDETMEECAQTACELFEQIGGVMHQPANPDWPTDRYARALDGAKYCCASGPGHVQKLEEFVRRSMHDSRSGDFWALNSRRGLLQPQLGQTGFGRAGGFRAVWIVDASHEDVVEYDMIAWPPPGFVPVKYWRGTDRRARPPAWSVHLNPALYALPSDAIPRVRVYKLSRRPPLDAKSLPRWRKRIHRQKPVMIHGPGRLESKRGRPPGLVWMPVKEELTKGARFWVEIDGLLDENSGAQRPLRYYVEGM